ncbi:hypothetical protein POM88_009846 [Heracleum sosnowskyi]|uniref:KIB1-4 beta-propeller domain-containing protein n=1 Tax=Heracleum sosnowskyi TaxID=360622 RepID=A0AAD8J9W9_9APIA|nr:hypothetical protein POM88_009846 [Heracleum sosnowskyi]
MMPLVKLSILALYSKNKCHKHPPSFDSKNIDPSFLFTLDLNHLRTYASHDGWLLLGNSDFNPPCLYNPITLVLLQLPPLPEYHLLNCHMKFVSSGASLTDHDCIICLKFSDKRGLQDFYNHFLAFCRPASSTSWVVLHKLAEDFIFYGGNFYTIGRGGDLFVYNSEVINGNSSGRIGQPWKEMKIADAVFDSNSHSRSNYFFHLLESKHRDLLMVMRTVEGENESTTSFRIFKLNKSNDSRRNYYCHHYWKEISNLPEKESVMAKNKPRLQARLSLQPKARLSIPPRVRLSLPPRERLSLPPKARLSIPPRARLSIPPRARLSLPPRARLSLPPRERLSLPPRARLSLPPRARLSLPPRARLSLPPRERLSLPPRARVSLPPRATLSLPPKATLSLPPRARLSLPPRARLSLPPRARLSLPPRERLSLPPRARVSLPPRARLSLPPKATLSLPPRRRCLFRLGRGCLFRLGRGCLFRLGRGCLFRPGRGYLFPLRRGCLFRLGRGCLLPQSSSLRP